MTEKKEMSEPVQSARISLLMSRVGVGRMDRPVVRPALELAEATGQPAAAMELPDGQIVTGKTSALLGCSSAMLLNALKKLAGLPDEVQLLAPQRSSRSSASRPTTWARVTRACTPTRFSSPWLCPPTGMTTPAAPWISSARCATATCTSRSSWPRRRGIFRSLDIQVTTEPVYATKSLYRKK